MTEPAAVTRIALLRSFPGSEAEDDALGAVGLTRDAAVTTGLRNAVRWTTDDADLLIEQWADNDELACASFTGPRWGDLAARLGPSLRYLPAPLLHRAARTASNPAVRSAVTRVLGQLYSRADGTDRWHGELERTLELAWQDADPTVRLAAATTELECHPRRARRNIDAARATDPDSHLRDALAPVQRLAASMADPGTMSEPAPMSGPAGAADADDGPLVLPFHRTGTEDELVSTFGDTPAGPWRSVPWGDGTVRAVVVAPPDTEVEIELVVDGPPVGCAAFTGADPATAAIGSAHVLPYLPLDLAAEAARTARDPVHRVAALQAQALASSRRLFPGVRIDPALGRHLDGARSDPDPRVRSTASRAVDALRDELRAGGAPDTDEGRRP